MVKKPIRPQHLEIYQPSTDVQREAQKLLMQYPPNDLQERTNKLSVGLLGEREKEITMAAGLGGTVPELLEGDEVRMQLDSLSRSQNVTVTAQDIQQVTKLILDLAQRKPLMRRGDNQHLLLFESTYQGLPARITKSLEVTKEWCGQARASQEEKLQELIGEATQPASQNSQYIQEEIAYIDKSAGMLHAIEKLTDSVLAEIKQQSVKKSPGRGAA